VTSEKVNFDWLNTLRALATVGVILIHVSTPVVKMCWATEMGYWWVGNILDSAVRFAVPVFLMLSGATLLGKENKLKDFYLRRFKKIFLPLLFWIFAYLVFKYIKLRPNVQPAKVIDILRWGLKLFLEEGISKHFWYMYMILFIYVAIPFAGTFIRRLNQGEVLSLLMVWLFLAVLSRHIPFNAYRWSGDYVHKFYGYLLLSGFLLLGYYLSKIKFEHPLFRIIMLVIFVFTIIISLLYVFCTSTKDNLNLSIYSYLSINTIVQSFVFFLMIKGKGFEIRFLDKICNLVADYSYGIFMIHIMILGILFDHKIYWQICHPVLSVPLLTVGVLLISFGLVWVLRQVPYVGKYVG
jgi:surface polysaccharide O-acyltransferase-like enzyme